MGNEKLQLTAAILNSGKEIEIYHWLALITPEYGTKSFNKRFETWLNKQSVERFGTHTVENWGMNGTSKEFENVSFYLNRSVTYDDTIKFELSINYRGKTVRYDYDTKKAELRERNENEKLYSVTGIDAIVEQCNNIILNRYKSVEKMQSNLRNLPKLIAQRDKLRAEITAFNDTISYAISDSVRVK